MFVKVYEYFVQKDKVEDYLRIQEKTSEIYGKYIKFHSIYLNSIDDETKWVEISKYEDEDEYKKSINLINDHAEIQELFKAFQSLLIKDKSGINEEDFLVQKEIFNLTEK